ncbi:MAG: DUF4080 domain-containing protein [Clostridia bacterium]|nr:DUF4080 domain-containing protein [Oscillospiraceae bacterium]MBQ7033150.1 DUF4080 domain-containing protein [Clostridia bacterium]
MKSVTLVALNAKYCHTSLAIRSIGAVCREKGIPVRLLERSVNEPFREIMRAILSSESDIYAFSCYLWNIELVRKVCVDLKVVKPDCEILLGGPEVSFDPETYDFADSVICGEGEAAVSDYAAGKVKGKVVYSGHPVALEALPFCYTDADLSANKHRLLYYESSRGCPYACSYCLSSVENGVRFKSVKKVCAELKRFDDAKVELVKFVDRTFNADRERALAIWKFAAEKCTYTKFHFELAGELLREKDLAYLKTVPKGRFQFEIGIQSTSPATLKAVDRSADLPLLFDRIRRLAEAGNIHVHTDLIAGLPYETYEVFKKSFDDVYALGSDCIQVGFLKLLKGSKIRAEAEKFHYRYSAAPPYELYENEFITTDEIFRLERIAEAVDRFCNSHAFERSIGYAVPRFASPFAFYEAFSKSFDTLGAVARKELYALLHRFYTEQLGEDAVFSECLKFDWAKQMRGTAPPEYMGRMEPLQAELFALLQSEGFKEKYLPGFANMKNKEIIKHVFIRKFALPELKVYLFTADGETDITEEYKKAVLVCSVEGKRGEDV